MNPELEPLDPLSKDLLDAARGGHAARAGRREQVRRRIIASVGAVFFTRATLATGAAIWLKVGAGVCALAIGGGGAEYFVTHRAPAPAAARPSAPAEIVAVAGDPTPLAPPVDPPPAPMEPPKVAPQDRPRPAVEARKAPPQEEVPSIGAETALLLEAQSALRAGEAGRALGLLDEHEKRFPAGALSEERQASRVLALCAAGRVADARDAARSFLAAHPHSPAAARVRSSCGNP